MERTFPHPPEKVWRALTESSLISEWLMNTDFAPEVGRRFQFRADPVPNWDGVIASEVLIVEPVQQLSYKWISMGLETVVLWTVTPVEGGTQVRMEHSGFPQDRQANYQGATYGWQNFLGRLDQLLSRGAE